MYFNLYSNLPKPLNRVIQPTNVLAPKLTTMVMTPLEYTYIHLYEQNKSCYVYCRTVKIAL